MRFRGFALLLVAALAVAGCGGDEPTEENADGQGLANPRQPVQALLRERARSLLAGDVEGYLEGLSPEARAFEEPVARTALTLDLDRMDMTVGTATISDDGSRFRDASVTLQVSFKELPRDNPFRVRFEYDLDRQPDGSYLVTRSAFAPAPADRPPIWATGPVTVTRSEHFLVLARPGVTVAGEAAKRAEEGLARLLPKLTLEADDRFLFVLADNTGEYEAIGGDEDSIAFASAVYVPLPAHVARSGTSGLYRPEERFMAADRSDLFSSGSAVLEQGTSTFPVSVVLQHELAHLVLSRFTRDCMNPWVIEGAATLLSGEDRSGEWRALVGDDELDKQALNTDDGEINYAFTNAAVLYLVERDGEATFFDFYQNFKNLPVPGTTCSGAVTDVRSTLDERLLRRYYGLTVEELEGLTRDYVRKAVGTP